MLLSTAGIVVIVFAATYIDSTTTFPAPWALLPVAGAVLVIVAGVGAPRFRFTPAISNPVSQYLKSAGAAGR
jgi:peptidoglycan/LPS O-acetylase OafA/YrhL